MDLFQLFIIWREIIHRQITLFGPKAFADECVYFAEINSQAKSLFGKYLFTGKILCVIDSDRVSCFTINKTNTSSHCIINVMIPYDKKRTGSTDKS